MFKKILIANRGEIALRIIRTCKEMNIRTVAVYSTADKESLHVRFADEAVCIGPPPSRDSYLNIPSIISAAEITNAELTAIEAFFKRHNAPVFHEVSPLADPSLMALLNERSYQPIELTSVMYQTLNAETAPGLRNNPNISTRIIGKDEVEIWAKICAAGWAGEMPELSDFMLEFCSIGANSKSSLPFIAELDRQPIASGSMSIYEDVAMLAGASTIPAGRNKGAQTALLAARLRHAAEKGCTIAIMGALPGSQSQRNAEKNGFRIAYTRTKWQLKK